MRGMYEFYQFVIGYVFVPCREFGGAASRVGVGIGDL